MSAPVTVVTPPIIASSSTGRLWNDRKSVGPAEPCSDPNSAPANPASAADTVNTTSFVTGMLIPSMVVAAGLSRIADSRRPNRPRRTASTSMPTNPNAAASRTNMAFSESNVNQRKCGRGTGLLLRFPNKRGNTRLSMSTANASVASARYRPCRRIAGSATSAPTGAAMSTAMISPTGEPCPKLAMANAPSPANVIWQSDGCPP